MVKKSSHPQNGELIPFRNHLAPLWRCWYAISNLNSRRTILPPLVFQSLLKLEDHFVSKTSPNEHSPFTPKRTCRLHLPNIWCFLGTKQALLVSGYAGMEGRQFINLFGCRFFNFLDSWAIYNDLSRRLVTPNGWWKVRESPQNDLKCRWRIYNKLPRLDGPFRRFGKAEGFKQRIVLTHQRCSFYLSSNQIGPWLFAVGDYTTQLYPDYKKPLKQSV